MFAREISVVTEPGFDRDARFAGQRGVLREGGLVFRELCLGNLDCLQGISD
jgi:hypothetical protein